MDFLYHFFTPERILRIPAILIALTIHECAHGWVALKFGDKTALNAGRITLNPIVHLDPIGTALLLFAPFGWAKPVPVDPRFFKNIKKGIFYVSAAGPLSNIILAFIVGYLFNLADFLRFTSDMHPYMQLFIKLLLEINIGIAFFNLLPVPPLDGSKIAMSLIPQKMLPGYIRNTRYLPIILMALILIESFEPRLPLFSGLIYPIYAPFHNLIYFLIFWRLP